ncbi:hypothetical protein J2W35_004943 [Variovorax boronicumulans]|uniref:hypothetical protein n=1 Tax=Variovorax boronicumulans TaxID=436515 RepID=UPI00277FBD80|nr:hypothetical protein [Variovorax boronicumulans]MDQ0084574.1 hypothetical protein [Variovorax boronicumulans]
MALFPILADKVQLSTVAPVGTDAFVCGILRDASNAVARASLAGGAQFSNGLLRTALGQVVYVDATAGLPANTQFVDGLPLSPTGALCCSSAAAVSYSNGIPFAANGAVAADMGLGPELVTNGNFAAGSTGWTPGAGWSITTKLIATAAAVGTFTQSGPVVTAGQTYQASITCDAFTSGGWKLLTEGGANVVGDQVGAGTFNGTVTSPSTGSIYVWSNVILTASFTNVSFRKVL